MRLLLILSILSFLSITSFSQTINMTCGSEVENKPASSGISQIIGVDKDENKYVLREDTPIYSDGYKNQTTEFSAANADFVGAFALNLPLKRYGYYIEKYNNSSRLVFSKKIDFPEVEGEKLFFNKFYFINNQIVGIASRYIKSKSGKYLKAYKFNISKDGVLDNSSLKEIGKIETYNKMYAGDFDYIFSPDKSKILVYGVSGAYGSKMLSAKAQRYLAVYDTEFNLMWKKNLKFSHLEKIFFVSNKRIDNSGNITLSAKIIEKSKEVKIYSYLYSNKTDNLKEYKIDLPNNKVISSSAYFNDNTRELVVCGFYANKKANSKPTGFYYKTIDIKSGSIKNESTKNINAELLAKIESNEELSNEVSSKLKNKALSVRHFFPYGDKGDITMIAQFKNYFWKTGNLVVIKANSASNITMMKVIKSEINGDMPSVNRRLHYIPKFDSSNDNLFIIKYDGHAIGDPVVAISVNHKGETNKTELFKANKKINDFVFEPKTHFISQKGIVYVLTREKIGVSGNVKKNKFCKIVVTK